MSYGSSPLRVEQVLRLLPDVDALMPLRRHLVSTSQAQPETEPHRTVGKRFVQPGDLREFMPQAIAAVSAHLRSLYEAAIEAIEAEQGGDFPGVVRALLRAGHCEQSVGRQAQARAWYDHALGVAEGLRDRRPEIETLRHLGELEAERDQVEPAARLFERSFRLAENELDPEDAARACLGMADLAREQRRWQGAEAWYKRGLRFAENDALRAAFLHLGLGEIARARGQLDVAATQLDQARQLFESSGHGDGAVHTLNAQALLQAETGRNDEALALWREALAELYTPGSDRRLEMTIRVNMCQLLLDWDRLAEAEDEVRRAEERAIVLNMHQQLARLYLIMGKLRGRQKDDTGFVFFEKAIELCQGSSPYTRLEAEVYREYARFRQELGDPEEALAYLGRAKEILETHGDDALLAKVDSDLAQIPSH